jgi:acetyl esterase/lipase
MPFLFEKAALPREQVLHDIGYRDDAAADPRKHRLDLYLPRPAGAPGAPWPVLVFIHGGGWTSGDKGLREGGRDIYANIGRYFAARGIGVAVVNYRLQFEVTWREQVADVADAVAWLSDHVADFGGNPGGLVLAGHSAGAQLAARIALDDETARRHGVPPICGLIPVSGVGFDIADPGTYAVGASRGYYERRFRAGDASDAWQTDASPIAHVSEAAPPTLFLYAERDWPAVQRQTFLLRDALDAASVPTELVRVPGQDHYTIVLTLSRDAIAEGAPRIVEFVNSLDCARGRSSP